MLFHECLLLVHSMFIELLRNSILKKNNYIDLRKICLITNKGNPLLIVITVEIISNGK